MNTTLSVILMVVASVLAALGQLNLKLASNKLSSKISDLFKNYLLMIGFVLYGTATVTSIIALRGNELTVLYPIASLNYVWVSLLSMRYLKEEMNHLKWAGIALIVIGVVIIL